MLPAVLCGCETWSVTLREEHKLKVLKLSISVHCDWIIHSQNQRTQLIQQYNSLFVATCFGETPPSLADLYNSI